MSRIAPVVCPIIVGRDDLLRLAERRCDAVAAGRGHLLLLSGNAGIGKTRLLGSVMRQAAGAGFRTASGGLAPQDQDVPEAVLGDLARSMRRSPGLAARATCSSSASRSRRTTGGPRDRSVAACSSSTWSTS